MSLVKPLDIGPLTIGTNLILAPMSGVTDCAFRCLIRRCSGRSAGLLVSEFVASEGLTRGNEKTLSMLRTKELERPISLQIFGADPDRMAEAARMAEDAGADLLDVNCGCPAPKVVKRGGGVELMRSPDKLRAILAAIRRAVSIPFSVKLRAGWDEATRNAMEIARLAEGEGAAMVAVHGRTRVQLYGGEADWELVGRIHSELSIPVCGSGDVCDPPAALARLRSGYADGIMIGRAAIDNPWIFRQIEESARGVEMMRPSAEDRVMALRVLREELSETRVERSFIGRYRGLACRLVKYRPGCAAARRAIGAAPDADAVERVFADFVLGRRSGRQLLAEVA